MISMFAHNLFKVLLIPPSHLLQYKGYSKPIRTMNWAQDWNRAFFQKMLLSDAWWIFSVLTTLWLECFIALYIAVYPMGGRPKGARMQALNRSFVRRKFASSFSFAIKCILQDEGFIFRRLRQWFNWLATLLIIPPVPLNTSKPSRYAWWYPHSYRNEIEVRSLAWFSQFRICLW